LGLLAGWFTYFRMLIMPIVHVLLRIPNLAWIPVAILLLGFGSQSTVFIIFLAGFFPVLISTVAGVRNVDVKLVQAALMLGTARSKLLFKVLLPGAFPHLISGLRIGLANGWRALIAAEMVSAQGTGIGYAIYQARWSFDHEAAFAGILVIALIGICVEMFFNKLENRTLSNWGLDAGKGV
jgi:ABC-type nitrate/sulfonate/bicarbonate transport system permease component